MIYQQSSFFDNVDKKILMNILISLHIYYIGCICNIIQVKAKYFIFTAFLNKC